MKLSSMQNNKVQVITVDAERIDAAVAIQFKDAMRTETDAGTGRVVLDLTKVQFVDSSGLGAIVAAMRPLDDGRRLDLAGLTPTVDKVFKLTRMDTVLKLYDTLDDALAETDT